MKFFTKKHLALFLFILLIASFLRLYKLSDVPPGVNRDEASIGYTAYSLLQTGKDEYGRSYPISFQSFGDWKLPLYIYRDMPFVKVFGLNEFAVRFPSATLGIATVGLSFFLVYLLSNSVALSFITMSLMAISPWHLHFSRVGSEANSAVFCLTLGIIFFLASIKKKEWLLVPASLFLSLTYFFYAGNHISTTLILLGLVLFYKNEILKNKWIYIAFGLFVVLSGFLFYHTLIGADKTKISGIGIFGDPSVVHVKIEIPRNEHSSSLSLFAKLEHNKILFAVERISQNYLQAYSPQFLFIKGGENKAHNIEDFGNMYLVESIFLYGGLAYLLISKKNKERKFILWWFFVAPIAASITKDAPHSARMFAIFPILSLISAYGIVEMWPSVIKIFRNPTFAFVALLLFFGINFSIYVDRYYVHFPRNEVDHWGNGYKMLSDMVIQPEFAKKQVVITHPEYSPYIFLLFYQKYDPSLYQKQAIRYEPTEDKFFHVKSFGRYEFRSIDWGKDIHLQNTVLVDVPSRIPTSVKTTFPYKEIVLPNGSSMFGIVNLK